MRAALCGALAIPGSSGAGDPWLATDVRPAQPFLLSTGSLHQAEWTLDVRNTFDRAVRVTRMKAEFFADGKAVGVLDPATAVFTASGLESDPHVDPGESASWDGLCFDVPSGNADHARLTLDLTARRGVKTLRSVQTIDVPLKAPSSPPRLALPVRGWWRVTQGHACGTQHRRGRMGGEFAWDLVAINENGRSFGPAWKNTHRNADTETFGRPVYSPVDGTVAEIVDGIPDNDGLREFPRRSIVDEAREPKWIFGNHVVIDAGGGIFVLMGHLQKGSIRAAKGVAVRVGEPLARAGNSGSTVDSHVHLQVMDRADAADPVVAGVPAVFLDYVEITAGGGAAGSETVMRRVAAGDPPESAVLIAPEASPPPR